MATEQLTPIFNADEGAAGNVMVPMPAVTPAHLLQMAVAQGADLERLSKLMDLQERWEAREAKKAYDAAMAAFKLAPPDIQKNKPVSYVSRRTGEATSYRHATHDEVTFKIIAAMAPHGLTHAWKMKQENGFVYVTCTLTHVAGHSESVTMMAAPEDSGSKNAIQAVESANTYLQRYTLLAITGLSSAEMGIRDDDGRGTAAEPIPAPPEGFEQWWADMQAAADNGTAVLNRGWEGAPKGCRRFVVAHYAVIWEELKKKAAGVPQ
jgi:hypothetical protein